MNNLKLSIELIPKGAWGNNLREVLSTKDWDLLRERCYAKANGTCEICGIKTDELDAHEVWDFNIKTKTQTLKNIIALCSKCHGVKHMRNSERLGYGENAKKHFIKINKCDDLTLANHVIESQMLYDQRNEIYRWKLDLSNLYRLGGMGMEVNYRKRPMIQNPYADIDFGKVRFAQMQTLFVMSENRECLGPPIVLGLEVDNYQGIIKVSSDYANKIEWLLDGEIIKRKFNVANQFNTEFDVKNLNKGKLHFKLMGEGGTLASKAFCLIEAD